MRRPFAGRYREPISIDGGIAGHTFLLSALERISANARIGRCWLHGRDRTAIASGVNLIDTAINYRCQRSERAVGAAIQRVIARGLPAMRSLFARKAASAARRYCRPPRARTIGRTSSASSSTPGILTPDDVVSGRALACAVISSLRDSP